MSLPDQTPKLPKLPFLIGDAILIAAAWFIYDQSRGRLSPAEIYAVTACVGVGAILAAIPFLSDYARKQDEALDERQRGLEALSRTVNTAAEQISIAANGLHEITEVAHRNVKQAEQLPQKLQEKIAEFNAQLDNAREDDREEMEKELAELRASESERLQAVMDKIHKDVAELTKLDAAVQKHLIARTELLANATESIAKARADASAALHETVAAVTREIDATRTKALAEITAKFTEQTAAAVAAIQAAASSAAQLIASSAPIAPVPPPPATTPAEAATTPAPSDGIASPPKRPRKSRREETIAAEAAPTASAVPEPTPEPTAPAAAEPVPEPGPTSTSEAPVVEPPAESSATSAAVEPTAPASAPEPAPAEPVATEPAAGPATSSEPPPAPPESPAPAGSAGEPAAERPARKRAPRKPANEPHPELLLDLASEGFGGTSSDETAVSESEVVERVISSDGATRLIVTAYIGIGNRLFIRGEGPGLSWDKGVPLQFVSIGKWRWETMDATAPVSFKLYKNDETECALGLLSLDAGHQQEVTAKF
jgi:peptidoglycan hydrolase-like protein with peptidoglycan-binding domain